MPLKTTSTSFITLAKYPYRLVTLTITYEKQSLIVKILPSLQVLFCEDGQLDKRVFLSTWKDIPSANETQCTLNEVRGTADSIAAKMTHNNIFTIAKRNVEGQDMLYQSLKMTNNIWVLLELKLQPGATTATLSLKSRSVEVAASVFQAYDAIIKSP